MASRDKKLLTGRKQASASPIPPKDAVAAPLAPTLSVSQNDEAPKLVAIRTQSQKLTLARSAEIKAGAPIAKRITKKVAKKTIPKYLKINLKSKQPGKLNQKFVKVLLNNAKSNIDVKKAALLKNGITPKRIRKPKLTKPSQKQMELDDRPPVLEPILPLEHNTEKKTTKRQRVKKPLATVTDFKDVNEDSQTDTFYSFPPEFLNTSETPKITKRKIIKVKTPVEDISSSNKIAEAIESVISRFANQPKPKRKRTRKVTQPETISESEKPESIEDVMNDLSYLIKAEDVQAESDASSAPGGIVLKPKRANTKKQSLEIAKKKALKKENIENSLSKNINIDSSAKHLIDMLDLNVRKTKNPTVASISSRRHSIEKFPIGTLDSMDTSSLSALSAFSNLPRCLTPRLRRAAKVRQSIDTLQVRKSSPYTTRSDSPARILRNGKHRKLKDKLLDGLDSDYKKRRRLCSDFSGSEKSISKFSGYESDSSFSDLASLHGTDTTDPKDTDSSKDVFKKELVDMTPPVLTNQLELSEDKFMNIIKQSSSTENVSNGGLDEKPIKKDQKFMDTNSNLYDESKPETFSVAGDSLTTDYAKTIKVEQDMTGYLEIFKGNPSSKVPEKSIILDIMKQTFNDVNLDDPDKRTTRSSARKPIKSTEEKPHTVSKQNDSLTEVGNSLQLSECAQMVGEKESPLIIEGGVLANTKDLDNSSMGEETPILTPINTQMVSTLVYTPIDVQNSTIVQTPIDIQSLSIMMVDTPIVEQTPAVVYTPLEIQTLSIMVNPPIIDQNSSMLAQTLVDQQILTEESIPIKEQVPVADNESEDNTQSGELIKSEKAEEKMLTEEIISTEDQIRNESRIEAELVDYGASIDLIQSKDINNESLPESDEMGSYVHISENKLEAQQEILEKRQDTPEERQETLEVQKEALEERREALEERQEVLEEQQETPDERQETPEELAVKEDILKALGLQSLKSAEEAKLKEKGKVVTKSDYTGTLKTVIKLNRTENKKKGRTSLKITLQKNKPKIGKESDVDSVGADDENGYRSMKEAGTSGWRAQASHSSDTAGALRKSHFSNRSNNMDGSSEHTSDGDTGTAEGDDSGKVLVIPEKASSFSIHPGRLCKDECSYCFGKFGLFDTPCHIAQMKSVERQDKILGTEKHLTRDSCLCDACYRHVDRKSNTPSYSNKTSKRSSIVAPGPRQNHCHVLGCNIPATYILRRKWIIKMRKSICQVINIDLDNPGLHSIPLCEEHYNALEHLMVCAMCKRRLARNHYHYLGTEKTELNDALNAEGIPVTLMDKPIVCKFCRYFASLILKPVQQRTENSDNFVKEYKKRLLHFLDIELMDQAAVEESIPVPSKEKPSKEKEHMKKKKKLSKQNNNEPPVLEPEVDIETINHSRVPSESNSTSKSRSESPSDYMVDYNTLVPNIAMDCGSDVEISRREVPKKPDMLKKTASRPESVKEAVEISKTMKLSTNNSGINITRNTNVVQRLGSNPSISVRQLFPGEEDIGLQGNIDFNNVKERTPEGWEKCLTTIQYDVDTKRLWHDLQKPYGNQSSFLRHLILLEKYFRSGDLILSQTASHHSINYSESVQNRLRAYDNTPMNQTNSLPSVTIRKSGSGIITSKDYLSNFGMINAATIPKNTPITLSQINNLTPSTMDNLHNKSHAVNKPRNPGVPPGLISLHPGTARPVAPLVKVPQPQKIKIPITKNWRPNLIPIDPSKKFEKEKKPGYVKVISGGKPYHITLEDYNRMCAIKRSYDLKQKRLQEAGILVRTGTSQAGTSVLKTIVPRKGLIISKTNTVTSPRNEHFGSDSMEMENSLEKLDKTVEKLESKLSTSKPAMILPKIPKSLTVIPQTVARKPSRSSSPVLMITQKPKPSTSKS